MSAIYTLIAEFWDTGAVTTETWTVILILQLMLLGYVQRVISPRLPIHGFMHFVLMAPAVVLHELAHAAMAVLVGAKLFEVKLFSPREISPGMWQYGYVIPADVGTFRNSLISIAPVLLVPAMLFGVGAACAQSLDPSTWLHMPPALLAGWTLLCLLGSRAAFPSIGDDIGWLGGASLLIAAAGAGYLLIQLDLAPDFVQIAVIMFAPTSVGALSLTAWDAHVRARRSAR